MKKYTVIHISSGRACGRERPYIQEDIFDWQRHIDTHGYIWLTEYNTFLFSNSGYKNSIRVFPEEFEIIEIKE